MFGNWRKKKGVWWSAWDAYKEFGPYGGTITKLGKIFGIGQGFRRARKAREAKEQATT